MALLAELQKANDDKAPLVVDQLDDASVTPDKLREQAKTLDVPKKPKPAAKSG